MLTRAGTIALRALVELARHPGSKISGPELAARQGLPAAMLERLLLSMRRAGLVDASRGRSGGYQLKFSPKELYLEAILSAVGGWRQVAVINDISANQPSAAAIAGDHLELQLQKRLLRAMQKELAALSLAELLYDQRSLEAALNPEGGLMLG